MGCLGEYILGMCTGVHWGTDSVGPETTPLPRASGQQSVAKGAALRSPWALKAPNAPWAPKAPEGKFCPLCTPTQSLNTTLTLTPTPTLSLVLTLPLPLALALSRVLAPTLTSPDPP